MTSRLCALAQAAEVRGDNPDRLLRLQIMAADHARDVPGIAFRRGDFPVLEWKAAADARLEELEPRDADQRATAARVLEHRLGSEVRLLFGAPEAIEGMATGIRE